MFSCNLMVYAQNNDFYASTALFRGEWVYQILCPTHPSPQLFKKKLPRPARAHNYQKKIAHARPSAQLSKKKLPTPAQAHNYKKTNCPGSPDCKNVNNYSTQKSRNTNLILFNFLQNTKYLSDKNLPR